MRVWYGVVVGVVMSVVEILTSDEVGEYFGDKYSVEKSDDYKCGCGMSSEFVVTESEGCECGNDVLRVFCESGMRELMREIRKENLWWFIESDLAVEFESVCGAECGVNWSK